MISVIFNPQCSKCRQVKEYLQIKAIKIEYIDYPANGLSIALLTQIVTTLLVEHPDKIHLLFRNTAEFIKENTVGNIVEHFLSNPMNIQRPIIYNSATGKALIARPVELLFTSDILH